MFRNQPEVTQPGGCGSRIQTLRLSDPKASDLPTVCKRQILFLPQPQPQDSRVLGRPGRTYTWGLDTYIFWNWISAPIRALLTDLHTQLLSPRPTPH